VRKKKKKKEQPRNKRRTERKKKVKEKPQSHRSHQLQHRSLHVDLNGSWNKNGVLSHKHPNSDISVGMGNTESQFVHTPIRRQDGVQRGANTCQCIATNKKVHVVLNHGNRL
jgi:hypothetical protein